MKVSDERLKELEAFEGRNPWEWTPASRAMMEERKDMAIESKKVPANLCGWSIVILHCGESSRSATGCGRRWSESRP